MLLPLLMGDGRNSSSWLPWQQTTCLLHISSAALPSPPPSPSLHSQLTPDNQYTHFSLSPSPQQGFAVINAFISGFTMMGPFPNRGEGSGGGTLLTTVSLIPSPFQRKGAYQPNQAAAGTTFLAATQLTKEIKCTCL